MLTRLKRPGEDELMAELDQLVRQALSICQRCSGIYEQTGLVPVECDVCGQYRGMTWTGMVEHLAVYTLRERAAVLQVPQYVVSL
jgi:hypothetical protein